MKIKEGVVIKKATQELVNMIKGNLRFSDKRECYAASGKDPDTCLQLAFEKSALCWVGVYGEEPFNVFGVTPFSILGSKGSPWMLGTNRCLDMGRAIIAGSKEYIQKMLAPYEMLENWVDVRNKASIRWLKWCGFNIEPPEPYGFEGRLFHRFWLSKREVSDV